MAFAASPAGSPVSDPTEDYDYYHDEFYGGGVKAVSPNALKGQIRRFLIKTNMKVGAFQQLIGVGAGPYNKFMTQKYKNQWSATQSSTYSAAAYFFFRCGSLPSGL
eukprot:SAG31_NODE_16048_length_725_cov_1.444089_1_plen_106_part_00